jgi:hypothetical protein
MSSSFLRVRALRCRDSAHAKTHVRARCLSGRLRSGKYREVAGAEAEIDPAKDRGTMCSGLPVLQQTRSRLKRAPWPRPCLRTRIVHRAAARSRARSMFCSKPRPKVPRLGPSPFVRSAFPSAESHTHSAVHTPARKSRRAMVQDLPHRARPGS